MSSAASWSYTAKATLWPLSSRNDWDGGQGFGAPILIDCDYAGTSERLTDAKGEEFVSRLRIFTEHSGAKQGDRIALGSHTGVTDPLTFDDAAEVRLVRRYADTFERKADDFEVVT
jgi:hypothetical protein